MQVNFWRSVSALQVKFMSVYAMLLQFGVHLRYAGQTLDPSTLCRSNLVSVYAMQVKFGVRLRSAGEFWGLSKRYS